MIDEADSCRESNAFDVSCQHCGRYIIASRLIAELANQQRWPIARETMAAAVQWASLEKRDMVLLCSMPDVLGLVRRLEMSQQQSPRQ